jgi:hypothetical protein
MIKTKKRTIRIGSQLDGRRRRVISVREVGPDRFPDLLQRQEHRGSRLDVEPADGNLPETQVNGRSGLRSEESISDDLQA